MCARDKEEREHHRCTRVAEEAARYPGWETVRGERAAALCRANP